ncbi:MAG: hypothetical protein KDJ15_06810 [Alphaproteobacteria bacterium]|nr:hypothetical protein [Alphaproteobacteria bacterium]
MLKKTLLASALLLTISTSALADDKDERIAALEAQMSLILKEIEALKAENAPEKQEVPDIAMKGPTPKIQKGEFSWQPTGRIHLDAGIIDDDKKDNPNSAEFRRARLGMQGTVAKDFGYKAEIDFANETVAFKDVYVNYTGLDQTEFRIGHFKPGYSLEDMTSSNDITFIERSAATEPFSLSEQIGAGVINYGDNYHVAAGAFNDDAGRESDDDEQWSISGRLTGTPYRKEEKLVHIGGSVSYREPDQANDRFDYDSRAENRLQTTDSVSAVINDGKHALVTGLEAAVASGPFSAQGEYVRADIENRAGNDPHFYGATAQLAYTLTGENRPYSIKKGAFTGITPTRPFDPVRGEWGAFEIAARYSYLDLNDGGINGGKMETVTLGTNWYPNDYARFMFNVVIADTDRHAVTPDDDPVIFLTRSQMKF